MLAKGGSYLYDVYDANGHKRNTVRTKKAALRDATYYGGYYKRRKAMRKRTTTKRKATKRKAVRRTPAKRRVTRAKRNYIRARKNPGRTSLYKTAAAAKRHTKLANTPKRAREWADIYNSSIEQGYNERRAIMMADGVLKARYGIKTARKNPSDKYYLWSRPIKGKGRFGRVSPHHLIFNNRNEGEKVAERYRKSFPKQEFIIADINGPTIAKHNPYTAWVIKGHITKPKKETWYFSVSGGFTKHKKFAEVFNSASTAQSAAKRIQNRLPYKIEYITVERL